MPNAIFLSSECCCQLLMKQVSLPLMLQMHSSTTESTLFFLNHSLPVLIIQIDKTFRQESPFKVKLAVENSASPRHSFDIALPQILTYLARNNCFYVNSFVHACTCTVKREIYNSDSNSSRGETAAAVCPQDQSVGMLKMYTQ